MISGDFHMLEKAAVGERREIRQFSDDIFRPHEGHCSQDLVLRCSALLATATAAWRSTSHATVCVLE